MMDVDDEDGTQRPRRVDDYGIELDFDMLEDDEREVRTGRQRRSLQLILYRLGLFKQHGSTFRL